MAKIKESLDCAWAIEVGVIYLGVLVFTISRVFILAITIFYSVFVGNCVEIAWLSHHDFANLMHTWSENLADFLIASKLFRIEQHGKERMCSKTLLPNRRDVTQDWLESIYTKFGSRAIAGV